MTKNQNYSVLIIDDHPLITEAYINALNYTSKENSKIAFDIETVNNCDDACFKIKEATKRVKKFDLIFLDIKLPPSKDGRIISGEGLGLKINSLLPESKIIISTTFNDNYRIHCIFQNINPDGFLIKNDINLEELISAIKTVLFNPPYYSKTVIKQLRKEVSNDLLLDKIDRKLIYELSLGTKTKDFPSILPLSIAGIEKRKRHLKEVFDISTKDDRSLIAIAREKGFI
jgi:DNA-binding NarL/FixJ family response regulator